MLLSGVMYRLCCVLKTELHCDIAFVDNVSHEWRLATQRNSRPFSGNNVELPMSLPSDVVW